MKTILIADEDERIKNVVRLMFEHIGYEIVATSGGVDTILKAEKIKPDIVLANVSLSDKDGYEVSREIKSNPLLKDTPVILLTSSLGTFDETRAVEVCADDFITKPFIESREITKKVEFFTSQNQKKKIRFTGTMVVILVILLATIPILYQIVNKFNLSKIESKMMPPTEKEKNVIAVSKNGEEPSGKAEPLRVKEEKLEAKVVRIETFETRQAAIPYGDNLKDREAVIVSKIDNEKNRVPGKMQKRVKRKMVVKKEKPEKVVAETSSSEGKGTKKGSYLSGIKVTGWSLYVAWGSAIIHHVTIENSSDTAYKDIKVRANYYYSYSTTALTPETGRAAGTLPVNLPPHSKKIYLKKGVVLKEASASSMYIGPKDIEILGAIPVPNLPATSQVTDKLNAE